MEYKSMQKGKSRRKAPDRGHQNLERGGNSEGLKEIRVFKIYSKILETTKTTKKSILRNGEMVLLVRGRESNGRQPLKGTYSRTPSTCYATRKPNSKGKIGGSIKT